MNHERPLRDHRSGLFSLFKEPVINHLADAKQNESPQPGAQQRACEMKQEIWDLYCPDGTPAGREMVRGESIPAGLCHLVCEVLVRHTDGDYLLMRRSLTKDLFLSNAV